MVENKHRGSLVTSSGAYFCGIFYILDLVATLNTQTRIILAVVVGTLANSALGVFATTLEIPIFLDMTFTIVVAALYGWLPGTITGLLTAAAEISGGCAGRHIVFIPTGVLSALIVGVMRQRGRFCTVKDGVAALVYLTIVNAVLGAAAVNLFLDGLFYEPVDLIVIGLILTGRTIWSASLLARIPLNLLDKAPGVILALILVRSKTAGELNPDA